MNDPTYDRAVAATAHDAVFEWDGRGKLPVAETHVHADGTCVKRRTGPFCTPDAEAARSRQAFPQDDEAATAHDAEGVEAHRWQDTTTDTQRMAGVESRLCLVCGQRESGTPTPPAGEAWDVRGGSLWLDRDEWGVVTDALIAIRSEATRRKAVNPESTSDIRADMAGRIIRRLNDAARSLTPAGEDVERVARDGLRDLVKSAVTGAIEEAYTFEGDLDPAVDEIVTAAVLAALSARPVEAGEVDPAMLDTWRRASEAARKAEHHFPADNLAEAVEVVQHLARDLAAALARATAAEERADRLLRINDELLRQRLALRALAARWERQATNGPDTYAEIRRRHAGELRTILEDAALSARPVEAGEVERLRSINHGLVEDFNNLSEHVRGIEDQRDAALAHAEALRSGIAAVIGRYAQDGGDGIEPEDGWRLVRDLRALLDAKGDEG